MDAVCRNITIIGEASRRLDDSFRGEHPEIPWSKLIGARNIVKHTYHQTRPEVIQEMAEKHVPELRAQCLRILTER